MTAIAAGCGNGNYSVNPNGMLMRMGQQSRNNGDGRTFVPSDGDLTTPNAPPVHYPVPNGLFQPPTFTPPVVPDGKTIIDNLIEKAKENPMLTIGVLFLIARMTRII